MDATIKCKCGNDKFELRYVTYEGVKSIIAHCTCGKVVEYRDFKEAILAMSPDMTIDQEPTFYCHKCGTGGANHEDFDCLKYVTAPDSFFKCQFGNSHPEISCVCGGCTAYYAQKNSEENIEDEETD